MLVPQDLPAKETRSRGFLGGQCGAGASSAVFSRYQIVQSDQCNFDLHKAHQCLHHIAGAMRSMLNFDMKSRHRESTIGLDRKVEVQRSAICSIGNGWLQRANVVLCLTMMAPKALTQDHMCQWPVSTIAVGSVRCW